MKMRKIKLLFDVEQLSTDGLKGTGIVRVADVLLQGLLKKERIDIYPIITSKRGDFDRYLKEKGLYNTLKDKIIYLPKLKSTTKQVNWYQKIRSFCLTKWYGALYKKKLDKFDVYLSLFSPISPIVYQSGVKTYMFIHDLIPIYYPDGCNPKFVEKFTSWIKNAKADGYFCVSNATLKDFLRFRKDEKKKKIIKLYLGADEKFRPSKEKEVIQLVKEKYHIPTKHYFLAVSEITARKNLPHLLKSFVQFLEKTKEQEVSLVLVGPKREGYEALTNEIESLRKYQEKIIQTGYVDEADLPFLYQGATAFIYPSLYEGFGLPILEAMQSGTAVISADNTSLPEVGGDAVFYITGLDEIETTQALEKLYFDKNLNHRLRQKGLKRAQKFNWEKTIDTVSKRL